MFAFLPLTLLYISHQVEGKSCPDSLDTFRLVCGAQYEVLHVTKIHNELSCSLKCSYNKDCVGFDFSFKACTQFKGEINAILYPRNIMLRSHFVNSSDRTCFPNPCLYGGRCNRTCDCDCPAGLVGKRCELKQDCSRIFINGVHTLYYGDGTPYKAYCDKGWTIIMRRYDGSQDFYLDWEDYKNGFGNLKAEFWLGNEILHRITNDQNYMLHLEFKYWENQQTYYARYQNLKVGDENGKYKLSFSGYEGNNSNNAMFHHNNEYFSTRDRDNDSWDNYFCARLRKGGFWYFSCLRTNPTGIYKGDLGNGDCMFWFDGSIFHCLSAFTIKIKPQ